MRVEAERIVHETGDAMLVELADGREVWIPFSQCDRITRKPDGSLSFVVSNWLANKEDL